MLVHTDITSNSARCVYSRLITTPGKRKTPSWLAGKHPNWQDCSSAEAKQKKWKTCASVPTWCCAGKKRKSKKFNLFAFGNEHNRKHMFGYFTASLSGWPVAGIFSSCYDQYICIFFSKTEGRGERKRLPLGTGGTILSRLGLRTFLNEAPAVDGWCDSLDSAATPRINT